MSTVMTPEHVEEIRDIIRSSSHREVLEMLKRSVDLTAERIEQLESRVDVLKAELEAANQRARMMFEAKNMWMERAIAANPAWKRD